MSMHFVNAPKISMANDSIITVQVCYVAPHYQFLKSVQVAKGSTIRHAIQSSGLVREYSEMQWDSIKVGIYSKPKNIDTILKQHDRVEVYRSLLADPMVSRRVRAEKRSR